MEALEYITHMFEKSRFLLHEAVANSAKNIYSQAQILLAEILPWGAESTALLERSLCKGSYPMTGRNLIKLRLTRLQGI